jgi:hypothetical protein
MQSTETSLKTGIYSNKTQHLAALQKIIGILTEAEYEPVKFINDFCSFLDINTPYGVKGVSEKKTEIRKVATKTLEKFQKELLSSKAKSKGLKVSDLALTPEIKTQALKLYNGQEGVTPIKAKGHKSPKTSPKPKKKLPKKDPKVPEVPQKDPNLNLKEERKDSLKKSLKPVNQDDDTTDSTSNIRKRLQNCRKNLKDFQIIDDVSDVQVIYHLNNQVRMFSQVLKLEENELKRANPFGNNVLYFRPHFLKVVRDRALELNLVQGGFPGTYALQDSQGQTLKDSLKSDILVEISQKDVISGRSVYTKWQENKISFLADYLVFLEPSKGSKEE